MYTSLSIRHFYFLKKLNIFLLVSIIRKWEQNKKNGWGIAICYIFLISLKFGIILTNY